MFAISFKRYWIAIILIVTVTWVVPARICAYVMPVDQLLGLMADNFSNLKTLVITQTVHLMNQRDPDVEIVLKEKLWLKSPGFYGLQSIGQTGGQDAIDEKHAAALVGCDMLFRRLLIANGVESIKSFLSDMGINLDSVSLTRIDGVVSYRLGDKGYDSPKLVLEKDTFFPLLLSYGIAGNSGHKMATVRFDDYRKLAGGWYSYKIVYRLGEEIIEHYRILSVEVNVPIKFSPLKIIEQRPPVYPQDLKNGEDVREEERLREIIRLLEDKYQ